LLNATGDIDTLRRWWAPGVPYNIGLRTGRESNILVIDVDPRHAGDETLAELERRFGELPLTWRVITGGGGQHIYFRHPGGKVPNSAGKLGPGIDARGDGGFAIMPPSRHISGRHYFFSVDHHPDDVPLADTPDWLLALVQRPVKRDGAAIMPENWRRLVAEGVAEGCRNHAVARLAGHLLRKYVDPLVALDLCRVWNAARCRPPLDDLEVVKIVDSISGREIARRGQSNGR
jgi:putative DNA primase/helicase